MMVMVMEATKQQCSFYFVQLQVRLRLCVRLRDRAEASRNGHGSGQRAPSAPALSHHLPVYPIHPSIISPSTHPHPPSLFHRQQRRRGGRPLACLFSSHVASSGAQRRRLRSALRPGVGSHPSLGAAPSAQPCRRYCYPAAGFPFVSVIMGAGATEETVEKINKSSIERGRGHGMTTLRTTKISRSSAGGRWWWRR